MSNENSIAKHTPGPWKIAFGARDFHITGTREDTSGHYIARTINDFAEDEANARLIAAAPELLEALNAVAAEVGMTPEAPRSYSGDSYLPEKFHELVLAALAKAEGRA